MTENTARDMALLQGRWRQTALEADGQIDPVDDIGEPGAITELSGDRFCVTARDGRVLLKGRFELDADHDPPHIDWIDAIGVDVGKRLRAIYLLGAQRFEFIAADADLPRPQVFRTRQGQTLRRFERVE
ncbi:TIGR03067 domain-containing protein [Oleiagrimonas sp. C23AA]|uniref:TIGR03067 domain-containing protein n=1 Tax=Oleiagrimonas sp. C23AA TaxID=2719047 RepID=UPI00141DA7ED|nr:TIGR03067 domain-containing protein [Oleiagrimonas sp. C23AA]NII09619.1 TIGR03067 domain-containing protein [Oleiagrimonas sp. C23AA]